MKNDKKELISIVVPCKNEQEAAPLFYAKVSETFASLAADYELIFVDDGSTDATLETFRELAKKDKRVRYISFSRNFGKESAMFAGFEAARGDYVGIMDADLQDPPELVPQMYSMLKANPALDCVASRRVTRKGEPKIRSFFARMFYKLINRISETEIVDGARDFRLMSRKMTDAVLSLKERNRFSKGIFSWVGFKTEWLEYENAERVAGETKWSFGKLLTYAIDGIIGFSTAPLSFAVTMGLLFCAAAFILIAVVIVKTLVWGDPVAGYPSLVCIILLLAGIQLFTIGVVGKYLSKTYIETKARPIYIISETEEKK